MSGEDYNTIWSFFANLKGFTIGFVLGGVTGYFGNWLWYRFGPIRDKPHYTLTSIGTRTSFSGLMTEENQKSVIRALQAVTIKTPSETTTVTQNDSTSSTTLK